MSDWAQIDHEITNGADKRRDKAFNTVEQF